MDLSRWLTSRAKRTAHLIMAQLCRMDEIWSSCGVCRTVHLPEPVAVLWLDDEMCLTAPLTHREGTVQRRTGRL